jgi:DNA replication licensing factor MCM3
MFSGLENKPERESFFRDFLSFQLPLGTYMDRVQTVVAESKRRLVVNLDDLRAFDDHVARAFIRDPNEFLPHWEKVLAELVRDPARFPPPDKEAGGATQVAAPLLGFDGALGGNCVTPRGLTSGLLRQLVMVEGIVTKGSLVKPKIVSTVQYDARGQMSYFKVCLFVFAFPFF